MRSQSPEELLVASPRCRGHAPSEDCVYRVEWRINPHMKPGEADAVRAEAQHRTLVRELRAAGADVVELPFVHGAFDSVFIKDAAVLRGSSALLARFAEPVRQAEQAARAKELTAAGFELCDAGAVCLEGGDVVTMPDGSLLLGYGFRSERDATHVLRDFGAPVVTPLELIDPWLYHLDTALGVLSDGTVLLCREAFTDESLRRLARHPALREVRFVPKEEALGFALNFVQIGGTVITSAVAPETTRLLEDRGLRVRQVRLNEFQLAGGSAACLVARVYGARRQTVSSTSAMRSTSA